ncbi:urea ABC transporter permease subunit UrtB [Ancylobacter sp. 6x-1]|uniref:Urea ABC transporter permease subunit UrtB n=1 Tax=Ancylobacter crimeensis TaxID=2579147 RepID=A0ABT0D6E8_9HYPH|nr:urea ABC transporter permease subunit UrtB [Ancylobacter crimeensis]MCK0195526.1 urea ABC transporter permease subunit UrtB [Ancylobacter crimeensis]
MRLAAAFLAFALAVLTVVVSRPAMAGPYEDALAKFTTESYADTDEGLGLLATSGNPLAVDIVEALADGRLLFNADAKTVYVKKADGSLIDAATGQPATGVDEAALKPVRANNRVRRAIEAASGALSLMNPDPAKRLAAAQAVFKSRDAAARPALETALSRESDPQVKAALASARAAIVLNDSASPEADRIAAVDTIAGAGNQDALALLQNVPADAPAGVKTAAASAVASIQHSLAIWDVAQNIWYGLSLGSVLLLAAIGLAITFGVMGVINMAHGEMVMLGAYVTFMVQEAIRTYDPGLFDASLIIAIPIAFLVTGLIGVVIERTVIRFLYGRPLETLLATWGISLILQQAIRTAFGPTNREVGAPSWMSGAFEIGHLSITYGRLWIIVFAGLVFLALLGTLRLTRIGLEMRAVTQNRRMAASMGIRTNWVDAMTFGLGSGIAGMAGVALSQIDNVSPNLGQSYIIDSFLVVVFGGVGNLWGTLVGAMSLGVANKLLEPYAGAVLGKIALLVIVILFIQKRPRGLFALKGRAIEA